jgi:hypothetical protein
MKRMTPLTLTAAAFMILPAAQALGQTSGTSHPELLNDNLSTSPTVTDDGSHYVKPSPAVPVTPALSAAAAPNQQLQVRSTAEAANTDDHYVPYAGASTPARPEHAQDSSLVVTDDINSGIVSEVHAGPNQILPGTVMKATLQENISTRDTLAGTRFTAALVADVGHNGRVLLPAGTIVHGRITQVRGGRRIGGGAAIRLQPDYIVLPDGTNYKLHAEVTDLDNYQSSHVNSEGSIVANGHPGATAAALGLTTTSAVVAGALIGGGVGAVVGLGVGAGIGAIWWLKQDHQEALPRGTEIAFSFNDSLYVGDPSN